MKYDLRAFSSKSRKFSQKITREAPGFFGGPSSLDHEGVILMKIFCKSGSGSQPHGKVPGRKKPERAQVHKKSKMFFKKRVLQLQKWQKMRVLRVLRVLCVLRVLRALRALRASWFQWFAVVFHFSFNFVAISAKTSRFRSVRETKSFCKGFMLYSGIHYVVVATILLR